MSIQPIKILEYEEGRVIVSLNAVLIQELKAIIDKYGDNAEPYLAYVYLMTALDSPFANVPLENDERSDAIIYEVTQTLGSFDPFEPLLKDAVDKVSRLYETPMVSLAKELEEELHRFRKILRDTPMSIGGDDSNFRDRMALMERIDKIATSFVNIKKKAEDEFDVKFRGNAELGEY